MELSVQLSGPAKRGRKLYDTWYKTSVLLRSGLDIQSLITYTFPAESWREAFDLIESGQSGKIILEWDDPN